MPLHAPRSTFPLENATSALSLLLPLLTLLTLLPACTGSEHPPGTPAYPPMPPVRAAATAEPAASATALALPCGNDELDNGVDDNCNGHIDEGYDHLQGELELVLSWVGPDVLQLQVEGDENAGDNDDAEETCHCTPDGTCTARWVRAEVSPGTALNVSVARSRVVDVGADVSTPDTEPTEPAPIIASVSIAAAGRSLGAFNCVPSPGKDCAVARVTVP